jgi:hypothetical protein
MAYTKYSLTPADNNAAPPNGAPEGMLPSAVNDTMRDMMSQIRDAGDGIRGGTYTMTAPVITGGSITGVALSGNTFTSPVITGGSINNTPVGATTASTGAFTTLGASGVATFSAGTVSDPAITTTGDTNTGIFFPAADTIAFTEGGVEAMRITSGGQVLIGTTTTPNGATLLSLPNTGNVGFGIDSSVAANNNNKNGFFFQNDGNLVISHADSIPTGFFHTFQFGGAIAGYIDGISAGAGVQYISVSDYRLKENISPMTGALNKVAQLKPCTYTWKANGEKADGFIAHELQEVLPNAVSGEKDAVDKDGNIKPQGIDTSYVVATLTAALQELKAELDSVKAELATLKA